MPMPYRPVPDPYGPPPPAPKKRKLNLWVAVCVHAWLCLHAFTSVYLHARVSVPTSVYVHACMHVVRVCAMHVCTHVSGCACGCACVCACHIMHSCRQHYHV